MNYTPRFDFEEDRSGGVMDKIGSFFISLGPRYVFGALVLVLIILGAIVFGLYPKAADQSGNIPIIRADAEPFKTMPDDPGGMEIANEGSTIFDAMSGEDADAGVENLLAENDSEDPMPRSQLFAGLNTGVDENDEAREQATQTAASETPPQPDAIENKIEEIARGIEAQDEPQVSETIVAAKEVKEDAKEAVAAATEEAEAQAVQAVEPAAGAETSAEPAADMNEAADLVNQLEPSAGAATPLRSAIPSGRYYVQVASVTNRSGTEGEWAKLTKKYDAALKGFKYRVREANLGEKGTYYRIQAGPTSKEFASETCNKIKAISPGGCLIVKE